MRLFKKPPEESGPTIYRPSEVAPDAPARQYRTLAVDPAPPSAVASELTVLTRVHRRRGAILTTLVSVAAIGSFCGVVWWAHSQNIAAGGSGLAPIIKADERPIREKPANSGGMQVANQDIEAYRRLNERAAPNPPEKLLPGPQQPKPPTPQQLATPVEKPPQGSTGGTSAPAAAGSPAVPSAPMPPAPSKAEVPAKPPEDAPIGPSISTILEQVSGTAGGWRIQLASVPSEEVARSTWARLQGSHGDVLGPLQLQASRADLGGKGVWYRVQAGPLDEKQAQSACGRLKERKVECILVPPPKSM